MNTANMKAGYTLDEMKSVVYSRIDLTLIMEQIFKAVTFGRIELLFIRVDLMEPEEGEINQSQLDKLEDLGYTVTDLKHGDEYSVTGWV